MRLAVISDIHGNYRALQAVIKDLDKQRIDTTISLGDNIGYGPEPEEVVQLLMSRSIDSIMGNHELALVSSHYYARLNPTSRESLDLTRALLSKPSLEWLETLSSVSMQHGARFVHGCPPASITTYLFDPSDSRLERIFLSYPEPICFAGHTHTLNIFVKLSSGAIQQKDLDVEVVRLGKDNRYLIIPGSVGQPRDTHSNKAKYVIWDRETETIELRAISYDVASTMKLIYERGFPSQNALRLDW
jgi:predicted phosphodiesterase